MNIYKRDADEHNDTEARTLTGWANIVHANAHEKGFYDGDEALTTKERVAVFFMNLHSEVSEAWESFRGGNLFKPCDKADKMAALGLPALTCAEEELADVVIRALDTSKAFGIDIERAVAAKHAYNRTREARHGGKLA